MFPVKVASIIFRMVVFPSPFSDSMILYSSSNSSLTFLYPCSFVIEKYSIIGATGSSLVMAGW
ncbi:hypothetical protein D3C73_1594920 [compost metagenome]